MKGIVKRILTSVVVMSILIFYFPVYSDAAGNDKIKELYPNAVYLEYSDAGVVAEGATAGYSITGTDVEITADGTYVLSGICSNGSITVKKNLTVTIVLNGIELTEPDEGNCPIWTKSDSVVNIVAAEGTTNVLSDASHDGVKPKACINANGDVNISGTGKIVVNGNNKNGIKADGSIVSEEVTLEINAAANGIAADNKLTVKSGNYKITDGNDGIKAEPETTDNSEDGNIEISGGTFEIIAAEDGIQAEANITINGGTFNITTGGGHTKTISSTDETSYKAIKAAKYITIYNGNFTIDSADDAIHSDEYVYMIGGTFNISTGDDGAHANTSLIIGEENGKDDNLIINVNDSYEGLEAGTVYIYSGHVNITASDDGINAAGGSDGNTNQGPGGGGFNPGGGGGRGPGGGNPGMPGGGTNPSQSSTDYSINISGGYTYLDVEGDGYDSNGAINITGGTSIIWGAASNGRSSDNSALDWEERSGKCTISGGTVFAAGSNQMAETPTTGGSQNCITISGTVRNKNEAINIVDGSNNAVFSTYAVKTINHVIYSSPSLTSGKGSLSNVTDKLLMEDGTQSNGSNESPTPTQNPDNTSGTPTTSPDNTSGTQTAAPDNTAGTPTPAEDNAAATPTPVPGNASVTASPDVSSTAVAQTESNAGQTTDTSSERTINGVTYVLKGSEVIVKSANSNIKTAVIPKTVKFNNKSYPVTKIYNNAFAGCKSLKSVTIGANIKKIGKKAFNNCKALRKIVFKGSTVPDIGTNAFKGINKNVTFKVVKKSKSKYKKAITKKSTGYTKTWKIK